MDPILVIAEDRLARSILSAQFRLERLRVLECAPRDVPRVLAPDARLAAVVVVTDGPEATEWLAGHLSGSDPIPTLVLRAGRGAGDEAPWTPGPSLGVLELPVAREELLGSLEELLPDAREPVPELSGPAIVPAICAPAVAPAPEVLAIATVQGGTSELMPEGAPPTPKDLPRGRRPPFPSLNVAVAIGATAISSLTLPRAAGSTLSSTGQGSSMWSSVAHAGGHGSSHGTVPGSLTHGFHVGKLWSAGVALAASATIALMLLSSLGGFSAIPGVLPGTSPGGGGGGTPGPLGATGELTAWVHDHPCACAHVYVTFSNLSLRWTSSTPVPSEGRVVISTGTHTWDLLRLNGSSLAALLGSATVPAGDYTDMVLTVQNVTVVPLDGGRYPATVIGPDAHLSGAFSVPEGGEVSISVDVNLATSLHVDEDGHATFTPHLAWVLGHP